MKKDDATVVIPQLYNSQLTRNIVSQIRVHEPHVRIIVLVNDPKGFPVFPGADPIYTRDENLTRSWNLGIMESATSSVILLNNDVVCKGQFVEKLSCLTEVAITGPKLRNDSVAKGLFVEGWCMCFSKELWSSIGGFDESMSLYCSDTYFQHRARKYFGCKIAKVGVPLEHLEHKTAHNPRLCPRRTNRLVGDIRTMKKKLRDEDAEDK